MTNQQQQDNSQQQQQEKTEGETSETKAPVTFDAWIATQPDEIKGLYDTHTKGLRSALDSERVAHKDLEKQVRELAAKADKGSQAQTELTGLADKIADSDRRADFYDAAHTAGVTNLKLAYLAAVKDELFDRQGRVNFDTLRTSYPELFAGTKPPPKGNAGEGTQNNKQPGTGSMNDFIRAATGRGK
jgi:hypothetical protein